MLSFGLNKRLSTIAIGQNLEDIVFNLIEIAGSEEWLDDLGRAAKNANPDNTELDEVLRNIGILGPIDSEKQYRQHSISNYIPPSLLYQVNRGLQKDILKLYRLSHNISRPLVCIVHGYDNQCLEAFIDHTLPTSFPMRSMGKFHSYHLAWPSIPSKDERKDIMSMNLFEKVFGVDFKCEEDKDYSTCADQCLREVKGYFSRFPSNAKVLISTFVSKKDWEEHKYDIINGYLDFWKDWEVPIVACLCIKYQWQKDLMKRLRHKYINNQIEKCLKNLDFSQQPHRIVLPKLDNIPIREVDDWGMDVCNTSHSIDIQEMMNGIKKIYENSTNGKNGGIPMNDLVGELQDLLICLGYKEKI